MADARPQDIKSRVLDQIAKEVATVMAQDPQGGKYTKGKPDDNYTKDDKTFIKES